MNSSSSSSSLKGQSRRCLLQENLDRFIPNRSAMDFDFADYKLNEATKKVREIDSCFGMSSPSREAYRRQLAEIFNMNRTRILAFKNKPLTPVELIPQSHSKPTCSPLLHHCTDALFLRNLRKYCLLLITT